MPDAATPIARLHAAIDVAAARLTAQHRARLRCRLGCVGCCTDDLTVSPPEAAHIRQHHADLLAQGTPHPAGACAFLDAESGACRVYDQRPYVCRTQGLPLRWIEEVLSEDGSGVDVYEYRDICPLNDEDAPDPPLEELEPEALWTLGPVEEQLAEIAGDDDRRINLRDMFAASASA